MKYAVETKVFNHGCVKISAPKAVKDDAVSIEESREYYDYYFDVFNSRKEALDFFEQNKES